MSPDRHAPAGSADARRKQRAKQLVRAVIGEPYVGKRLKQARMERALDRLDLDPAAILDAGSEDATFVYWLADRYVTATVLAVDVDAAAIAACIDVMPERYAQRVAFRCETLADLPAESFDLVTAFDVLEHIDDDIGAVHELVRALRRGGHLLVHVPRNRWTHTNGQVEVVPDDEAWRINPGHVRMGYSPESLRALLEGAGLVVVEVDIWLRRWAVRAHRVYRRLEHPAPLRLLSIPVTNLFGHLDRYRPAEEGNAVWAVAQKR
ncbi:class I SAM-dependent methyltransferase [Humibacter sp.]|uniref:class I SAM-dependent methyltransferase n=1 Tax=Humibacter sp. TaxID=1940291 RepID=UPI002D1AD504|nr:class I SAM-dependent methyltransferase [Humibacter sp.]HVX07325.1 class I SAM-dependent methyltransferase [Humibacter sp.]